MSSTNRGAVRRLNDGYQTPSWLVEAVMPYLVRRLATVPEPGILEPACGDGSIVWILEAGFPKARIDSGDLTTGRDFLTHRYKRDYYDLIISNPPYKLAREFIDRAFYLRPRIIVLLLTNLLPGLPGTGTVVARRAYERAVAVYHATTAIVHGQRDRQLRVCMVCFGSGSARDRPFGDRIKCQVKFSQSRRTWSSSSMTSRHWRLGTERPWSGCWRHSNWGWPSQALGWPHYPRRLRRCRCPRPTDRHPRLTA